MPLYNDVFKHFMEKIRKKNIYQDISLTHSILVIACAPYVCRPRWLSWMRRPTGDQEVAGSTPVEVGNILSWRLIMKYFLRSFSPFR